MAPGPHWRLVWLGTPLVASSRLLVLTRWLAAQWRVIGVNPPLGGTVRDLQRFGFVIERME